MADISIYKDVSFNISNKEREILKEAKKILEELQNKWIEKDNDALNCKRCKDIVTAADVLRDVLDFD